MLDALIYILLTLLGCGIFVCAPFLYRWVCWLLHFPLDCVRRILRWINWEKVTMFILAGSAALVTILTVAVRWGQPAVPDEGIDIGIYEGLRVAFSIFEGDSALFRDHLLGSPLAAGESFWAKLLVCLAYGLPVIVPISALSAAITLLWNHLPHHVPIFCRNWYIFSELDANSIRMAKSIHKDLKKAWDTGVFIFLRTRRGGQTPEILEAIRELNYFLYPKTEARFLLWPHRRLRRMRFFFLSEQTDENFERMQELLEDAKTRKLFFPIGKAKNDVFQQELYLLSETESAPMLIGHLRKLLKTSRCFRNTELRLLDRFRATSYDLLRTKPLYEHLHDGKLHILVLGFGKIGREFFRAACSLGILHDCTTEFTLCDLAIGQKLNAFLCQCPELRRSVIFRSVELNAETDQLDDLIRGRRFNYILVALGDDERNIRVTSRLKGHYRRLHWAHEAQKKKRPQTVPDIQPQICVNIEDSIKHDYTRSLWEEKFAGDKALHVFGGLDQVFTQEVLMPQNLWKAARWLHRELNRNLDGTLVASGWGEYERRSSIACAAHAQYHVATVAQNYLEFLCQWKKQLREDGRSEYDHLIDTEHRRWMAYVRSEGLRKAGLNLVDVYYDEKYGRHVDILGKLTPCLVDTEDKLQTIWEQLTNNHESYTGKRSFRQRDELLIWNSQIIASGIETGDFPERAITEIPT